MRTKCTPAQRARDYLRRIAALTEAEQVGGGSYFVSAGGRTFLVDERFVRLISPQSKSTCFSVARGAEMPSAEVLASVLLHLKNNPKLFKKWRKKAGYVFKANGRRFRGS
jgi:hypothetical protein